jgi:hypothetical protein
VQVGWLLGRPACLGNCEPSACLHAEGFFIAPRNNFRMICDCREFPAIASARGEILMLGFFRGRKSLSENRAPRGRLLGMCAMSCHLLPIESMAGVLQLVCYFFTMLVAALTYLMVRH